MTPILKSSALFTNSPQWSRYPPLLGFISCLFAPGLLERTTGGYEAKVRFMLEYKHNSDGAKSIWTNDQIWVKSCNFHIKLSFLVLCRQEQFKFQIF